jgi:hypothetical protein
MAGPAQERQNSWNAQTIAGTAQSTWMAYPMARPAKHMVSTARHTVTPYKGQPGPEID